MTEQYYFETIPRGSNHPGRIRERLVKHRTREQHRQQKAIEASQREAAQIRSTTASLNLSGSILDSGIAADLEKSLVRNPRHYAYPISAMT